VGDHASTIENHDPVDCLCDLDQDVAGDQRWCGPRRRSPRSSCATNGRLGVDPVGWFVQDQHVGVTSKRGGKAEALVRP
jgi:hypothetical protein